MQLTGAEIIVECLKEQGVDTIFGYPGGTALNIYDAIYKHQDEIKHYLTSHEQGAAHAADGYARSTGKVGVCLATSGPGATNLVTGIATAYMDSIPMVAITANVALPFLGKDSFQEIDIAGVTMPITKHNFIVKDVDKLADTMRRAFYIAKEGRQGPVLVDVTKDVTANKAEYTRQEPKPITPKTDKVTQEDIEKAVEMIKEAKQPLVYAGGGVKASDGCKEITKFVEKIDAPVCLTAMGLGVIASSNEHCTGMIGMHGTETSNILANKCDLLIAIGARFSDRVATNFAKFAPNAKVLHIDIDAAEINKNISVYHSIVGDCSEILKMINEKLNDIKHDEWMAFVKKYKEEHPLKYAHDGTLKPQYIMERINAITNGEAIIATEVGQHQMWACQFLKIEKARRFLTSGGLGTMGYGLGAAIGAKAGNKDRVVFDIAGDGCFYMNNIELATSVANDLPVIVILINNHVLGMVRQW
ncbi:MAG: biosynthetic-type acetolactate synthase large subunit, partial [Firmicutes bacterium]|nr:biosynthetic-type acetolactate synthase large subunit [Bacillota bacterium]